jgi:hypothetical protein
MPLPLSVVNKIVALTNNNLAQRNQLTFKDFTAHGSLICQDKLGRRNVIVLGQSPCVIQIQSVVREKRRGKEFTWLVSGGAGRNSVTVGFWDGLIYHFTFEEVCEYLKANFDMRLLERWLPVASVHAKHIPDFEAKFREQFAT